MELFAKVVKGLEQQLIAFRKMPFVEFICTEVPGYTKVTSLNFITELTQNVNQRSKISQQRGSNIDSFPDNFPKLYFKSTSRGRIFLCKMKELKHVF